jgi:arginine-tRNA-protein transferase
MTEQLGTRFPQFYLTQPSACPYLPGRFERKVFTKLTGGLSRQVHESLTKVGFRRCQNIAYRPACDGCSACTSVRILVDAFEPSRNLRRVANANEDLAASFVGPLATEEQFHLLRAYLDGRHRGGGMSEMGILDFVAMVEDTTIDTHIVEFRDTDGRLVACALSDAMSDGLSMVYSFFAPDQEARSLGTYMVLHHIEAARHRNLPYVYLGYLVEGCRKMSYKARFGPLEAHGPDGWTAYKGR